MIEGEKPPPDIHEDSFEKNEIEMQNEDEEMKEGEVPQLYKAKYQNVLLTPAKIKVKETKIDKVNKFYSRLCLHLKKNLKSTFDDRVIHINVSD